MFWKWDMVLYEKGKKRNKLKLLKLLRVIGKKIVLCLKEKSNILFCKCGHICICKNVKKNTNQHIVQYVKNMV